MVTIARYSSLDDAHMARMRLEGSGVAAFIADEAMANLNWLYIGAIGGVRLQVRDEDVERARETLELPPSEEGLLRCPHCGSGRVLHRKLGAVSALSIIAGVFLPLASSKHDCLDCRQVFTSDELPS